MDTMKKIYIVLIGLIVLSFGATFLMQIGEINEYSDTGTIVSTLALLIICLSILISRSANLFGERKHLALAYVTVFFTLAAILITAGYLSYSYINEESNLYEQFEKLFKIGKFLFVFFIAQVLTFEVPTTNSSHEKFQIFTSIIIVITFALSGINFLTSSAKETSESLYYSYSTSSYYSSYSSSSGSATTDSKFTIENAITFFEYASICCILINPMLRVYYIDRDYYNARDINDLPPTQLTKEDLANPNTVAINTPNTTTVSSNVPIVPNASIEEKKEEKKIILTPTPVVEESIVPDSTQLHHEPVINQNYKPDELPEAEIPTLDMNSNQ